MKARKLLTLVASLALGAGVAAPSFAADPQQTKLLNVSYDPTRELYEEINRLFAENYKQQRMAEAAGEANRFLALLEEYRKAPEITRSRLYLDAMSRTLPKVKMYVIDSQGGRVPVNLRVSAP